MRRLIVAAIVCGTLGAVAAGDEKKSYTVVELRDKVTHKLADKFGNDEREGNFLTIKEGEQTLEGVKFKIDYGVIQLGSKVWTEMPEKVGDIKLDRKFAKLHILHACGYGGGPNTPGSAWHVEDGTEIGEYVVRYEDKSVEKIPVVYGKDVRDWWFREDEAAPSRAKVAWEGDNELAKQYKCRLRLYLTTWENPKADKKVVSIDYVAKKDSTVAAPFCAAMSTEEK